MPQRIVLTLSSPSTNSFIATVCHKTERIPFIFKHKTILSKVWFYCLMYNEQPILWRTCRVIANLRRLELLWCLFAHGPRCLFELAEDVGISDPQASIHLYALASQGLIRQHRKKMRLISVPESNTKVAFAEGLLTSLQACHQAGMSTHAVFKQVTAFTHARRIEIIQVLPEKGFSIEQLAEQTHISESSLARHLAKLTARGFIRKKEDHFFKEIPPDALSQTLFKIIDEA